MIFRYVREWLAVMVTSLVFTMDKDNDTYFLPRSRVTYFKDKKSRLFFEEMFIMFPQIIPKLEKCFKEGGGIPYSSYSGFHRIMNEMATEWHNNNMLQKVIPSIKGLHEKLQSGITCLDIGCGMGTPSLILGEAYPNSKQYGFDFSEDVIDHASKKAEAEGLHNTHFIVKDCAIFDPAYEEKFDFISAHDAIHDQAKPAIVLKNIYRMLKKGGVFSMIDIDSHSHPADNIETPKATLKYTFSMLHCMPVSLYFEGGAGLGACWGKELAAKMLQDAGFDDVEFINLEWDAFKMLFLTRKY